MTLVWRPGFQFDADASTYIEAVEAADTQALETGVRYAINDFVIGCKQDGIWDAIKASCILAGARTLDGALVPLVGTAPTNYNFVSGNYNRETGLQRPGGNVYLDSNRPNDADSQDNRHVSVYLTEEAILPGRVLLGANSTGQSGGTALIAVSNSAYLSSNTSVAATGASTINLCGATRSSSSTVTALFGGQLISGSALSQLPTNDSIVIFGIAIGGVLQGGTDARIAFYSIGEALDLAALDTRVSALITAIGAAIP
jgi:hypothetical protein